VNGTKLIINFPTKTHWRRPSEYSYIEAGLTALAQSIRQYAISSIALPALGCGNGGLDWTKVKPIIEQHLSGLNANITIYEPR
jgi:O-acetyl-ADP-ribose deacetylase (regulator of RNase III)